MIIPVLDIHRERLDKGQREFTFGRSNFVQSAIQMNK